MANEPKAPKRLLPIGIQDFPKVRESGCIYVDKTLQVYRLISGAPGAFFLSRPRRFGKSLLCSTLGAIFEGRRELFGEIAGRPALAMDTLDWEWKAHPVIHLDLNAGEYFYDGTDGTDALNSILYAEIRREAEKYDIKLDIVDSPANQFKNLIKKVYEIVGEMVVVIIDEYDKPLTSTLSMRYIHLQQLNVLMSFYGILKPCDAYLRFVFLTGESMLSPKNIFSDLNHVTDLTLNPCYADICGFTQEEVEANFEPEIVDALKNTLRNRAEYMGKLHSFYYGYRFSKDPLKVYNPFGLLKQFENNGEFWTYTYSTVSYGMDDRRTWIYQYSAIPSFIVELIQKGKINILYMNNIQVIHADLGGYDIDKLVPAQLLCQIGCLTITDYDERRQLFTLNYPNEEVRQSFAESLLKNSIYDPFMVGSLYCALTGELDDGEVDGALEMIKRLLSYYTFYCVLKKELHFQMAVHLIFNMLCLDYRVEENIVTERIDILLETNEFVYCFEFKLHDSANAALAQIDTNEYAFPWTGSGKKVFKVGVSFDYEKRNVGEWVVG